MKLKLLASSILLAAVAALFPFATAQASSPVVLPVTDGSGAYISIYSQDFSLTAGDKLFISSNPLIVANGSWGTGQPTNVGTTTRITCTLSSVEVMNVHYGQNNTPTVTRSYPVVRGLLTAASTGTYTCSLSARAYSSAWATGMAERVLGTPGFTTQVAGASSASWSDTDASIPQYVTANRMTNTISGVGNQNITVLADEQFTLCRLTTDYSPLCQNHNSSSTATVKTWIEVQPLTAGGAICGSKSVGLATQAVIIYTVHHQTLVNQAAVFIPSACDKAQITLKAMVVSGNTVVAHGGYNYAHSEALL